MIGVFRIHKIYSAIFVLVFFSSCVKKQKEATINDGIENEKYIVYNNFPSKYVSPRNIEVWLPNG